MNRWLARLALLGVLALIVVPSCFITINVNSLFGEGKRDILLIQGIVEVLAFTAAIIGIIFAVVAFCALVFWLWEEAK
jgi:hypothetical protein